MASGKGAPSQPRAEGITIVAEFAESRLPTRLKRLKNLELFQVKGCGLMRGVGGTGIGRLAKLANWQVPAFFLYLEQIVRMIRCAF
jgi:hypothetical protein